MGIYSIRGSAFFDERLNQDFSLITNALKTSDVASLCRALVLIGGYGRGEGTPLIVDGEQQPFNDYDFVVVSVPMSRRRRHAVQKRLRLLELQLTKDVGLPVDLQLYPANVLPRSEFSLLNYEMKHGHKVVWGDQDVLCALPDYPHDHIPLSEGTRLLLNRGKLLLDVRRALRSGKAMSTKDKLRFVKFVFKAVLAFGDCSLLIAQAYDISYAVKKKRITNVLETGDVPDVSFLVKRYRGAVELKEWGDYSFLPEYALAEEFESIRKYYLRFFQWYEAARLRAEASTQMQPVQKTLFSPDQSPAWKNMVFNALAFRARALKLGPGLYRHPRFRLYRSLIHLLSDDPVDTAQVAAQLLMSESKDLDELEERFYQLHRRFS